MQKLQSSARRQTQPRADGAHFHQPIRRLALPQRPANVLARSISHALIGSLICAPWAVGIETARAESTFPAEIDLSTPLPSSQGIVILGEPSFGISINLAVFGGAVASAGDVNGDGFDDVIVGDIGAGEDHDGAAYVLFGGPNIPQSRDLSALSLDGADGFKVLGDVGLDENLGSAVASAGDINNDGFDDMLVAASKSSLGGNRTGAVYVIFGRKNFNATLNLTTLDSSDGFKIAGEAARDYLGNSVSAAGDINGDGVDDIILSAVGEDTNGTDAGAAYVIFGGGDFGASFDLATLMTSSGDRGFKVLGALSDDSLGYSVSAAGDVNGDGQGDLIIGAGGATPDGVFNAGTSYLIFGGDDFSGLLDLSSTALDGTNGFSLFGRRQGAVSGFAVGSPGDMNGDGLGDIAVGAPFDESAETELEGMAFVAAGSSNPSASLKLADLDGTNGLTVQGESSGDQLGRAVSGAGDFNGDGLGDVIVGSRAIDANGAYSGAAYVIFGASDVFTRTQGLTPPGRFDLADLDGGNGFKISGANTSDQLANALSSAGDFNGDGVSDLIVGAPSAGASGKAYVLYGGVTGLGEVPAATVSPNSLTFEDTEVSATGAPQAVVVSNSGTTPLAIAGLTITGSEASDFSLASDDCSNQTLAVDEECTFSVAMTPSAEGARQATLAIPSNALTSPETIPLAGSGFVLGTTSVSAENVDFGAVQTNQSSRQTITVSNTGPGSLALADASLSGPAPDDFEIVGDNCSGQTLEVNESCQIEVAFDSDSTGVRQATLTIPSNNGNQTIALNATASAPVPVPTLTPHWLAWLAAVLGGIGLRGMRGRATQKH